MKNAIIFFAESPCIQMSREHFSPHKSSHCIGKRLRTYNVRCTYNVLSIFQELDTASFFRELGTRSIQLHNIITFYVLLSEGVFRAL